MSFGAQAACEFMTSPSKNSFSEYFINSERVLRDLERGKAVYSDGEE